MNIVPIGFLLLKQSHDTSSSHRDKITGLSPVGGRKDKSIAILEADVNVASLHGNDVSYGNHTKVLPYDCDEATKSRRGYSVTL